MSIYNFVNNDVSDMKKVKLQKLCNDDDITKLIHDMKFHFVEEIRNVESHEKNILQILDQKREEMAILTAKYDSIIVLGEETQLQLSKIKRKIATLKRNSTKKSLEMYYENINITRTLHL